jgi:hypothetical protein
MPTVALPDLVPNNLLPAIPNITPLDVLRRQATLIGDRTNSLVEGEVETAVLNPNAVEHRLILRLPTLNDYRRTALLVHQDPTKLYPVKVIDLTSTGDDGRECNTQTDYEAALRTVFESAPFRELVSRLVNLVTT